MKECMLSVFKTYLLIFVGLCYLETEFGFIPLFEWLCDNWYTLEVAVSDFTHEVGQWLS